MSLNTYVNLINLKKFVISFDCDLFAKVLFRFVFQLVIDIIVALIDNFGVLDDAGFVLQLVIDIIVALIDNFGVLDDGGFVIQLVKDVIMDVVDDFWVFDDFRFVIQLVVDYFGVIDIHKWVSIQRFFVSFASFCRGAFIIKLVISWFRLVQICHDGYTP